VSEFALIENTMSQHFLGPDIYGIIAVNAAGVRYSFVGDISQF
jgi:hypothetical protein